MDLHPPFVSPPPIELCAPSEFLSTPTSPKNVKPDTRKRYLSLRNTLIDPTKRNTTLSKPKQSKSRDGCLTCKKKRLKCDEAKPTCLQCHNRGTNCEGYKRDLKWKSFENSDFIENGGIAGNQQKAKAKRRNTITEAATRGNITLALSTESAVESGPARINENMSTDATKPHDTFASLGTLSARLNHLYDRGTGQLSLPNRLHDRSSSAKERVTPLNLDNDPANCLTTVFTDPFHIETESQDALSPSLLDMLMSNDDFVSSIAEPFSMLTDFSLQTDINYTMNIESLDTNLQLYIDLPRHESGSPLLRRCLSPPTTTQLAEQTLDGMDVVRDDIDMLIARFIQQTCGILSLRNGPSENPWRTIIWPMAKESPALYHAIASMAAFHGIQERPHLRIQGLEHVKESYRLLQTEITTTDREIALATCIVLAFAVSWNKDSLRSIHFLHGARTSMCLALARHKQQPRKGSDLTRLKFLCNTWVYIDVISRITAVDDDVSTDFDQALEELYEPSDKPFSEVDPLMGCASKLFPLVGRVANLCRKVCTMESNSIAIISEANELKESIQQWQVDTHFRIDDQASIVGHAIQTAEAYRYTTLLYLHQAVPELPSLTTSQLVDKILKILATVPETSQLLIVHVYPLFVAGCEAKTREEREFVEKRWLAMRKRMKIENIESCWTVTQEVWSRNDEYMQVKNLSQSIPGCKSQDTLRMMRDSHKMVSEEGPTKDHITYHDLLPDVGQVRYKKPRFRAGQSLKKDIEVIEDMDPESTVRGRLHWVDVLRELNWEVLLG